MPSEWVARRDSDAQCTENNGDLRGRRLGTMPRHAPFQFSERFQKIGQRKGEAYSRTTSQNL
jgi:hypothetical protein